MCTYVRGVQVGGAQAHVMSITSIKHAHATQNDHMNITIILIFAIIIMRVVAFPISYILLFGDHFLSGEYV